MALNSISRVLYIYVQFKSTPPDKKKCIYSSMLENTAQAPLIWGEIMLCQFPNFLLKITEYDQTSCHVTVTKTDQVPLSLEGELQI